MYRAATVQEMRREWNVERRMYLQRIDDLLAALLLATGKDVPERLLEQHEPVGFSERELELQHDFVAPLDVYEMS